MTRSVNDLYSAHQMKKQNKYDLRHKRNIKVYELQMDAIYREAIREAVSISGTVGQIKPDTLFSFDDYPITRKRIENLMSGLKSRMQAVVLNGINAEWTLANNKNSELANRVFGDNVGKLTQAQYRRYYSTNEEARDAFAQRKTGGLNLSQRVWRYTEQFKEEIEMGLDIGIRSGRSADEMSRDLRQYLKQPDKLFRRVRDEHGQLQLSKRAKAYHPGQGVYRSSYKNARRLAATETNIAYRTSDHLRWQQMDFVVGIEIHLSNNHTLNGKPFHDICDELQGRYPKDFVFKGWHPHCRCYATSILKTQEEIAKDTQKILNGETVDDESVNRVDDVPQVFKDWLQNNEDRFESASSIPYFLEDNAQYAKSDLLLNRQIEITMLRARQVGNGMQKIAVQIASKYDGAYTPINYKSTDSIRRKVLAERNDDPNFTPAKLKDAVRTTIVVDKDNIQSIISEFRGNKDFLRWKPQNTELGYTGNIINMRGDNGVIAEIQVNTPKMIYAKEPPKIAKSIIGVTAWNAIKKETGLEGGLGHKYYERYRIIDKESEEAQRLIRLSVAYYSHFVD